MSVTLHEKIDSGGLVTFGEEPIRWIGKLP